MSLVLNNWAQDFSSDSVNMNLDFTSSLHCFWHIWQYHLSFCRPLALILLAIALGVRNPPFSLPILIGYNLHRYLK